MPRISNELIATMDPSVYRSQTGIRVFLRVQGDKSMLNGLGVVCSRHGRMDSGIREGVRNIHVEFTVGHRRK